MQKGREYQMKSNREFIIFYLDIIYPFNNIVIFIQKEFFKISGTQMCVSDIYRTKKYASFSVAYMSCARILKQQASCIYHQTLHEFIYKVTLINIGRQNWYIFFVIITFYFIKQSVSLYTSNIKMATMSICKICNYQMKLLFLLQYDETTILTRR